MSGVILWSLTILYPESYSSWLLTICTFYGIFFYESYPRWWNLADCFVNILFLLVWRGMLTVICFCFFFSFLFLFCFLCCAFPCSIFSFPMGFFASNISLQGPPPPTLPKPQKYHPGVNGRKGKLSGYFTKFASFSFILFAFDVLFACMHTKFTFFFFTQCIKKQCSKINFSCCKYMV